MHSPNQNTGTTNSIYIHQYGVGRLVLSEKTPINSLKTGGLFTCIGIVIQGVDKISLLHTTTNVSVNPIVTELEWVGINDIEKIECFTNILGWLDWPNNDLLLKFDQFISKINDGLKEKNLLPIEASKIKWSHNYISSATVFRDKKIDTSFVKPIENTRSTIAFLNQNLMGFQCPEFDIQYDGFNETAMPKLNNSAFNIIKNIKNESRHSILKGLKEAVNNKLLPSSHASQEVLHSQIEIYLKYKNEEIIQYLNNGLGEYFIKTYINSGRGKWHIEKSSENSFAAKLEGLQITKASDCEWYKPRLIKIGIPKEDIHFDIVKNTTKYQLRITNLQNTPLQKNEESELILKKTYK